jgi:hypothetical protein
MKNLLGNIHQLSLGAVNAFLVDHHAGRRFQKKKRL